MPSTFVVKGGLGSDRDVCTGSFPIMYSALLSNFHYRGWTNSVELYELGFGSVGRQTHPSHFNCTWILKIFNVEYFVIEIRFFLVRLPYLERIDNSSY